MQPGLQYYVCNSNSNRYVCVDTPKYYVHRTSTYMYVFSGTCSYKEDANVISMVMYISHLYVVSAMHAIMLTEKCIASRIIRSSYMTLHEMVSAPL